jgi:lipoprotein-anchoring transpeptidase ErfK/SrfK
MQEDYCSAMSRMCDATGTKVTPQWLYVSVQNQRMYFYNRDQLGIIYKISTASKGISQVQDSEGTPLGLHRITEKIGAGAPWGTVFIGRKSTGKIFTEYDDWETKGYVTSRILRLKGLQEGYNSGGNCDTYNRYIYIHGITNEQKIGTLWTCGCIAMANDAIIQLFDQISLEILVLIGN